MSTTQEKFWKANFGDEYTGRNTFTPEELDAMYTDRYGISRTEMNRRFLPKPSIASVLEIGCNVGNQLSLLQSMGYANLYGIEINTDAIERAKKHTRGITIIEGSVFDIPFEDNYFDLVFTSGVLIHISPQDLPRALIEIYRVSKKFIWGFEYFAETMTPITYRGHTDRLWKNDFAKLYMKQFPSLKLIRSERYKYIRDENVDSMFLLEKK